MSAGEEGRRDAKTEEDSVANQTKEEGGEGLRKSVKRAPEEAEQAKASRTTQKERPCYSGGARRQVPFSTASTSAYVKGNECGLNKCKCQRTQKRGERVWKRQ